MAKIISKQDINNKVQGYLNVHRSAKSHFPGMPPAARKHYDADDISFVFEKGLVEALLNKPNVNTLRVYLGTAIGTGKPTIILVPANKDQVTGKISNVITSDADAGVQWPDPYEPAPGQNPANFDISIDTV